jgi:hypothetical protein
MDGRGQNRSERVTLAVGVIVSVALGVFFYFKTDLATAMATFAGLIGTTITLQVESIFRERRVAEGVTRQQRLVSRIEAVGWLPDLLDQALNSIGVIEETYRGTAVVDLTREAVVECLARLRDLQRGRHITSAGDDSEFVFAMTQRAQRTLHATSPYTQTARQFSSPIGEHFWLLNQDALRRGVAIERIFIYRRWNDQLEALARRQHDAGVHTLRVAVDRLPPHLRLDLVIWDGTCCGVSNRSNSTGEPIDAVFTFAPDDLVTWRDHYAVIKSRSEPWPAPPPSPTVSAP